MAVAIRSASGAYNNSGLVTVTQPAGVVSGDQLLALQYHDDFLGAGSLAQMGPAAANTGWTQLGSTFTSTNGAGQPKYCKAWTKTAGGAEPTSYGWRSGSGSTEANGTSSQAVHILALTGTQITGALGPTGTQGTSATPTAPTLTPGSAGGLLVCGSCIGDSDPTQRTQTPLTGMAEQLETPAVGTAQANRFLNADTATQLAPTSGAATGTKTFTATSSAPWFAVSLFIPAAAGTAYTQTITDAIGAADTSTRVATTARTITDAIGAADSTVLFTDAPQSYTRSITDTIGAADSTTVVTPLGGVTASGQMYVACEHKAGVPTAAHVRSATVYAWSGSALLFEVAAMPAAAGVDTAFAQMWMMDPSPTDTVDRLGFQYRAATNALDCIGQTGAAQTDIGTTTTLTYSSTTHRWLRISHTGSSIVWATSPDGLTWTTRRALGTPPSWTTKPTLKVSFEAYRTTGTNDRLLIDSVNLPPLRIVRPVLGLSAVGRSYSF